MHWRTFGENLIKIRTYIKRAVAIFWRTGPIVSCNLLSVRNEILSENPAIYKRHIDVGGRGKFCLWRFSVKNRGKFRQFWKICNYIWNHLYKVYKIQHFRWCIYTLSIFVCPLSGPGLAPSVHLYFYAQHSILKAARWIMPQGPRQSQKSVWRF